MKDRYSIGVDFGTESGRVVIVNISSGKVAASDVTTYKHGVMTEFLPDQKTALPADFALQHPQDYLDVLEISISAAMKKSGLNAEQIVGIGIDFTSSTLIPTDKDFVPLCFKEEWKSNPHSYVKLWKHHGSTRETDILNALAVGTRQDFLGNYGGAISCEWMIPKCVEIAEKAPECYDASEYFMEAGDWIVSTLTGKLNRSNCSAGFKSFWDKQRGYPKDFFMKISPVIAKLEESKLRGDIKQVGEKAGVLQKKHASRFTLPEGLPVATSIIDAHAAVLGMGAGHSNTMVMVMGTSTCHITLNEKKQMVEGISGVVENGIVPGLYAYEAGQSAVGDIFSWFQREMVPSYIETAAKEKDQSVFDYLENAIADVSPGETGLLALDWHNGNRSVLNNANLSGMLLGQTLQTKPEEVFLALMEATAYGAGIIMETYEKGGIHTDMIYACGGLPAHNKRFVQIYADVMNKPIRIASSPYVSAAGAAILGAVAAGKEGKGYETIQEAMNYMNQSDETVYLPNPENVEIYKDLFNEYKTLSNYFGKGANKVMERLKKQRGQVRHNNKFSVTS